MARERFLRMLLVCLLLAIVFGVVRYDRLHDPMMERGSLLRGHQTVLTSDEIWEAAKYDVESAQQPVLSREKIREVLAKFDIISFSELDNAYLSASDPDGKFRRQLVNAQYRIVKGRDMYQYVVGKVRIKSFLCRDHFYAANKEDLDANASQFWLVEESLLYLILDFIQALEEDGYDKYGFYVRESHRHPQNNLDRRGASQSLHIYGKAADLVIQDINQDGLISQRDKDIGLKVLEDLVGDRGGVGLYPGTSTIHIDTRGYRARWKSYKPATDGSLLQKAFRYIR